MLTIYIGFVKRMVYMYIYFQHFAYTPYKRAKLKVPEDSISRQWVVKDVHFSWLGLSPPRGEPTWSYLEFYPRGLPGKVRISDLLTGIEVGSSQQESLRDPQKQNMKRIYSHYTSHWAQRMLMPGYDCTCHVSLGSFPYSSQLWSYHGGLRSCD